MPRLRPRGRAARGERYPRGVLRLPGAGVEGTPSAEELLARAGPELSAALALEPAPLDPTYVRELLATAVSYNPSDLVLCDWNAAFVYDTKYDDTVAVLEFLNIQLLELRFQDGRLDRALERFGGLQSGARGLGAFLNPYRQPVRELAELTIESALRARHQRHDAARRRLPGARRAPRRGAAPLADWWRPCAASRRPWRRSTAR
jgi:hypothetical protein